VLSQLPLFPDAASSMAREVDYLYFFLVAVSAVFTIGIFAAVTVFAIRYRRRDPREIPKPIEGSYTLETVWSVIPLAIAIVMFGWGAEVYFNNASPPQDAMEVYVTGKQWMWKLQHPEGQREINELHIPVGRPVRLVMATEDVIHSFYVPAFRVKQDVVPGRYAHMWFTATKPGTYHLFCAEYCGNQHSGMIGWIYAMEPAAFEAWLSGPGGEGSMASRGEKLFQQYGCSTCHLLDSQGRCPNLRGVFGNPVKLTDGTQITADEAYIRESILNPRAKTVAGFEQLMPTFQGQINEEGLLQLIAYIRSLSKPASGATTYKPTAQESLSKLPGQKGQVR
jgi:cytochrome c oxidase subunit II